MEGARFAGHERALERLSWDQVTARVHAPKLATEAKESVALVARSLGGESAPQVALRMLVAQIERERITEVAKRLEPRVAQAPAEIQDRVARFVVQRHLGLLVGASLVEAGGAWTSPLGAPHSVIVEGVTHEPFELATAAIEDPSRRTPLLALAGA